MSPEDRPAMFGKVDKTPDAVASTTATAARKAAPLTALLRRNQYPPE